MEDTAFFEHDRQLSETLDEAARQYPGDPEVWYLWGEYRFHIANPPAAEVLRLFDRAIQLDSAFGPAYEHTLKLAFQVGGAELEKLYIRKYLDLGSTDALAEAARLEQMLLDPVQARSAEAASLLDTMSAVPLWNTTLNHFAWPDSAETNVRLARSLYSGNRSFRGAPPFVADSLVRRRVLALALTHRGHLREARKVGGLDRADGFLNPFIDLALIGGIPPDTVAAVLRRPVEQGEFWPPSFGQGVALPWWSAQHDTLSLSKFARRADSTAQVQVNPVARASVGYFRDAAAAYLALARFDSAAALRGFAALPDSVCLVNDCFFEKLTQARLYATQKQDREAAQVLDHCLHTRAPSPLFILGTLERGRVAERLQDPERAVRSYQFVADVWRRADPELQPYVSEARAGLARLTGETKR